MKISLAWLRELVPEAPIADAAAAAEVLTGQGLEVEGIEARGRELAGVLVAEVLAVRPHPGADKLRLVRVRAGSREEEVVCGAPNVPAPGGRVCWAAPGATLPGGRRIEAREVRGVLSPGMLCSEPEMQLGGGGDGILILSPSAPSGADLAAYLGVADDVLEVNVTPNRPDALSHVGIARELAARFGVRVRMPAVDDSPGAAGPPPMDVEIADPVACPRYLARFVTGLRVGPSPLAMRLRLEACGMRAISNLVDVTNYVLLEAGHPLHAFDLDKLSGGIVVRRARPAETMTTLDGQQRQLEEGDVVIADGRGAVALAGVMGGAESEVSSATTRVLLEAATFEPRSIRRTAKRLALHSEASYRFERGVDANGVPYAAARAAALLAKLGGGGTLVAAAVDRYPRPVEPRRVSLSAGRLRRLTGVAYTPAFAADKLARLGFECAVAPSGDALTATVPTYRPDVAIEEDLIEEVLRMGEYGRPPEKERVLANARPLPDPEAPADRARDRLAAAGLHEVVTWAFVPRAGLEAIGLADGVLVKNPISADYEVMRTSLLPGLADALRRNLARGVADVRLFEVGPIVRRRAGKPDELPDEPTLAAGLMAGRALGWLKPGEPLDFFDLKRVVEELLAGFGVREAEYVPAERPFLHPRIAAELRVGGEAIGCLGEVQPFVARRLGIEQRALFFEVEVDRLEASRRPARGLAPPRFPAVARDISFWIDAGVSAAAQRTAFLAAGEPLLRGLAVLEDFRDPRYAPVGKKGMLWTMTYRADDRTLTDAEVDAAHSRVVAALSARQPIGIR